MSEKNCRACTHCYMEPDNGFVCGHPDAGVFGKYTHVAASKDGHCGLLRSKFEEHPLRKASGAA